MSKMGLTDCIEGHEICFASLPCVTVHSDIPAHFPVNMDGRYLYCDLFVAFILSLELHIIRPSWLQI